MRVPLGVIGIIYESRPNVTADAGALCLKSGNAVDPARRFREPGDPARRSTRAWSRACAPRNCPASAIQLVPTTDRAAVGHLLGEMRGYVDVVVPRGGKSLVERVQREARVPVIGHLEGNCHVYVDRDADLEMARAIVLNAKLRRTGICGAAETLLVDRGCAATHLAPLVRRCWTRAARCAAMQRCRPPMPACGLRRKPTGAPSTWTRSSPRAWSMAWTRPSSTSQRYGSAHTESIVTANAATAERFLSRVDSAIVLHNASTQFADGGEFGMGAEIGISTDHFHARGPVGVEQLTSYKYVVRGAGQVR